MAMRADEVEYYGRQLLTPGFGVAGQEAMRSAHILVVGCGGLCAGALPSLVGVGVGALTLVDGDCVERSNLHRQTIHDVANVGMNKAESAALRAAQINPDVRIRVITEFLTESNALELFVEPCSLVLDCTDSLPSRRLISDAVDIVKREQNKPVFPVVSGSALRMQGQVLLYGLEPDASYRSLLGSQYQPQDAEPLAAQSCASAGVLGPVPQLIGHIMAIEAIKLLQGQTSAYNFLIYDMLNLERPFFVTKLKVKPQERSALEFKPHDYQRSCTADAKQTKQAPTVSWEAALADDEHAIFVDVRPRPMSDAGHKPGALRLPYEQLQVLMDAARKAKSAKALINLLGAASKVYFYCRRGVTARNAVNDLATLQIECRASWEPQLAHNQRFSEYHFVAVAEGFGELVATHPQYKGLLVI